LKAAIARDNRNEDDPERDRKPSRGQSEAGADFAASPDFIRG
jgi:hypothetical protein